jgi:hypothetical protein
MDHQYMLDQGDMLVYEATLRRLFLPPYQEAEIFFFIIPAVSEAPAAGIQWLGYQPLPHRTLQ